MNRLSQTLANGETIRYLEQGSGSNHLVLIHGNLSSSIYYEPLLERLPAHVHVIAPDLRGFGESSYVNRFDSLLELAEDVKALLDHLGIAKAHVVGWSLGGGVAMELAASYPQLVKSLTLLNSTTHKGYPLFQKDEKNKPIIGLAYESKVQLAEDPLQVKPVLDAIAKNNTALMSWIYDVTIYTVKKPTPEQNTKWIAETMKQRCLVDADWALANLNLSALPGYYGNGSNKIQNIACKTLHVWGFQDKTVLEYMLLDNATALKNQSTVIRFEQCGHSPLVDQIEALTQSILEFIA
jgi:pimeloyl-ACP methyl ester carboxylesterase